ncbi:ester cyclase [Prauserella muralis]|uniref:Polyketide cyclase n=1 Tax=Prauserella muralis TaxID=588067 RepID=A0A2V4B9N5_9PSEU|nr:nuclear transport factor 2 family protein [Prauserella muralis]PXY31771.1 polyketide cyclase [Prauserella muralis]TWE13834.1 ketosteroid isomerase-like protein [Prauserella muralis]
MTARELYDRWLHELWNGELDRLERLAEGVVAGDFVGNWPGRPALVRGPGQLAAVIRQGRELFDELRFEVALGPVGDGDLIAARWAAHGRHDGTPVTFHGHDLLRHADGRFTEYWVIAEDPYRPTA